MCIVCSSFLRVLFFTSSSTSSILWQKKRVETHLCANCGLPERWLPWLAGLLLGEKVDSAAGVIGDLK